MSEDKNSLKVIKVSNEVASKIIEEEDYSKLPDLIKLFKASIAKKEVLRIVKLTEFLDKIESKVEERFDRIDLIPNSELFEFMKVTQSSIDRANKMLSGVEGTGIPINNANNTINVINIDSEDSVSKGKIAKAVIAILNKAKESKIVDIEPEVKENLENIAENYTQEVEGDD